LNDTIAERAAGGSCEFYVLVPEPLSHKRAAMEGAEFNDPTLDRDRTGMSGADLAREYLYAELDRLHRARLEATGEVCDSDPVEPAKALVAKRTFDEIIMSTLHAGISRWLHLDVPSRLQRAVTVPVTVLTAAGGDDDEYEPV
jgi:GABA permease